MNIVNLPCVGGSAGVIVWGDVGEESGVLGGRGSKGGWAIEGVTLIYIQVHIGSRGNLQPVKTEHKPLL